MVDSVYKTILLLTLFGCLSNSFAQKDSLAGLPVDTAKVQEIVVDTSRTTRLYSMPGDSIYEVKLESDENRLVVQAEKSDKFQQAFEEYTWNQRKQGLKKTVRWGIGLAALAFAGVGIYMDFKTRELADEQDQIHNAYLDLGPNTTESEFASYKSRWNAKGDEVKNQSLLTNIFYGAATGLSLIWVSFYVF